MRRLVVLIGWLLVGLVVLGLSLEIFTALREGKAFYGVNYKGLALSTWGGALTLGIVAVIGVIRFCQLVLGWLRDRG